MEWYNRITIDHLWLKGAEQQLSTAGSAKRLFITVQEFAVLSIKQDTTTSGRANWGFMD